MSSIHPQAWLFKPSQAQAGMQAHKLGQNRAGWLGQNRQGFGSPLNFVYVLLCPLLSLLAQLFGYLEKYAKFWEINILDADESWNLATFM